MSREEKYKVTRIPSYVMDEIELAKAKILMESKKLRELPEEILKPKKCPICGSEMRGMEVKLKTRYYECKNCGYKQPGLDLEVKGTDIASLAAGLGIGTLIGLGIAALLYLLFGRREREGD